MLKFPFWYRKCEKYFFSKQRLDGCLPRGFDWKVGSLKSDLEWDVLISRKIKKNPLKIALY